MRSWAITSQTSTRYLLSAPHLLPPPPPTCALQGEFSFHFELLYTSLEALLPRLRRALQLAQMPEGAEQQGQMRQLVAEHEEEVGGRARGGGGCGGIRRR